MLRDAGVARLYDDVPAIPHKYTALQEMLAEARPLDTIVLVRFDQISTNGHYVRHYVRRICELRLNIRILQRATAHMPPTAAVLQNFDQTLFVYALPRQRDATMAASTMHPDEGWLAHDIDLRLPRS